MNFAYVLLLALIAFVGVANAKPAKNRGPSYAIYGNRRSPGSRRRPQPLPTPPPPPEPTTESWGWGLAKEVSGNAIRSVAQNGANALNTFVNRKVDQWTQPQYPYAPYGQNMLSPDMYQQMYQQNQDMMLKQHQMYHQQMNQHMMQQPMFQYPQYQPNPQVAIQQ